MRDDLGDRRLGDEAQIAGARGRPVGDQARDVVGRVQVDLLLAEAQRRPPFAEGDDLHAEHPRIEGAGALDIGQQKINLHPADNIPGLVADKPTPGSGDLCFITETPIAEVVTHLQQCGVPIITGPGPRAGAIGTIQSVYFRDPDQNLVEVSNY